VLAGLSAAAAQFPLVGVGIDSWGVDYGLLDPLIGKPVRYRDSRTDGVISPVPAAELYAVTGIQHLPFNTIYQLAARVPEALKPRLTAPTYRLLDSSQ
jgi:rhamnulokinase